MRFRKKPVEVEAFQMTYENCRWHGSWPDWLVAAFELGAVQSSCDRDFVLVISTLEGQIQVSYNDWIIKGVSGELYPCKPGIFERTYEPSIEGAA